MFRPCTLLMKSLHESKAKGKLRRFTGFALAACPGGRRIGARSKEGMQQRSSPVWNGAGLLFFGFRRVEFFVPIVELALFFRRQGRIHGLGLRRRFLFQNSFVAAQ